MNGEYTWKEWISVPKNKELYNGNMQEGLRQFKIEKSRRDAKLKSTVFLHNYNNKKGI
tara:strand:- start:74 stop:247 length:174 start_codon:yes stop_codon:yes gene_type:complete